MHQQSGDSRRPQQSEKPQSGPYLLGENFKRLYRVAHCIHKKKNVKKILVVLCVLSNCVCNSVAVSRCTCMHVCLHMFPGMHGNRSD